MTTALEPLRRIAAYAVITNEAGQVLLVRASAQSGTPGVWSLPGGAVDHGEHPNDTVVRETAAETGLSVAVTGLRDVLADMRALPHRGVTIHTDRVIYAARVRGGALRERVGQPTDLVDWFTPEEAARLPLRPFTAGALGITEAATDLLPDEVPDFPSFFAVPGPDGLHRAQRFAAYAVVTDRQQRVLLTRIAENYPGAGKWHLPGGGTDFGETPAVGLLREIFEESAQTGEVTELLRVNSNHNPAAMGPEGEPYDWYVVRAVFRVRVPEPTVPSVTEAAGGSTAQARWFTPAELGSIPLTDSAQRELRHIS